MGCSPTIQMSRATRARPSVEATIRLSTHILAIDPDQLPSQLAGRTVGRSEPALARLHAAARAWQHTAWLCPIGRCSHSRGKRSVKLSSATPAGVGCGGQRATGGPRSAAAMQHSPRVGSDRDRPATHTHRPRLPVSGVAVSADGRTAISSGDDSTVRVWDLTGTAPPRILTGHAGPAWDVAVSADGRTAISSGDDATIRVWNLTNDREQACWVADRDEPPSLLMQPSSWLATQQGSCTRSN